MATRHTLKSIVLGVTITTGCLLQAMQGYAADTRTLVVAGGCFWCMEADFEKVQGVQEVISGFTGGTVPDPSYKDVVRGNTGHYEAVKISYDPSEVSYGQLLSLFFRSIDPTDADGQFCDRGDSYRSAVFVETPEEEQIFEMAREWVYETLGKPVVTRALPAGPFYPASSYHQDYYKQTDLILTRFGVKSKQKAYVAYREACGRDARVRELWGESAPFLPG